MRALLDVLETGHARARRRDGVAVVGALALLGAGIEGGRRYDVAHRIEVCQTSAAELDSAWSSDREPTLRAALVMPSGDRDALSQAQASAARASSLRLLGRYDEAAAARDAVAQAVAPGSTPMLALVRLRLGSILEKRGDHADAEAALEDAYFGAAMSSDSETAFWASSILVLVVGERAGRLADGMRWHRLAEVVLTKLHVDGLRGAMLTGNLATVPYRAGEHDRAAALYEQALATFETLGSDHPYMATMLNDHPLVASSLSKLANVLQATGEVTRASSLYERALAQHRPGEAVGGGAGPGRGGDAGGPPRPHAGACGRSLRARVRSGTRRPDPAWSGRGRWTWPSRRVTPYETRGRGQPSSSPRSRRGSRSIPRRVRRLGPGVGHGNEWPPLETFGAVSRTVTWSVRCRRSRTDAASAAGIPSVGVVERTSAS